MIDEIKKYVKEILMIVEFEIWERNREKHMILQTRNIQRHRLCLLTLFLFFISYISVQHTYHCVFLFWTKLIQAI